MTAVAEAAKAAGCTVSLDLASFEVVRATKNILPELLDKYIDIVFANEDEASEFCGDLQPEEQVAVLNRYCKVVTVKLGAKGSCIGEAGNIIRADALKAEAVDTTGAGDFWQAGFLFGLLNGKSLEICGYYGAVLGAAVVQVIGASLSEQQWQAVKQQLQQA